MKASEIELKRKPWRSEHKLYKVWRGMKRRCTEPAYRAYERYGGRGIGFCERWKDYDSFFEDMSPSYKDGLTLERIDNSLDYSPSNCRWATLKEQANNRRSNRNLTWNGETKTMTQWAESLGLRPDTFTWRYETHGLCEKIFRKGKYKHL